MIKVIFSSNNKSLVKDLSNEIISDVVFKIFGVNIFTIENDSKGGRNGRFIKLMNDDGEVHYICFSNPNNNSRNSHLMQFVAPAYVRFHKDTAINKKLHIYIIKPDLNDKTDYIKMFYRCFLTLDIDILNFKQINISNITSFVNYDDFKNYRNETSGRNAHNNQTYFTNDEEQISLYGKTFGANAMESFIFGLVLRKISEKNVVFYEVVDNKSKNIPKEQKNILTNNGIVFGDKIKLLPNGYAKSVHKTGSRNTPNFHYNLLQKFGEKRCYLCGCSIEHLVIGSHIERITDIDNNKNYIDEEKARRATDGDNGFWLCANHDKMFEFGIIYFEENLLKINLSVTDKLEKIFINDSIFNANINFNSNLSSVGMIDSNNFKIKTQHFNSNMKNYIYKHKNRVT